MDLLGLQVEDLQDGIVVDGDDISGSLLYVTDYTGFSDDPNLQTGYYLAIKAEVPGVDGVTITVVNNGNSYVPVKIDDEPIYVIYVDDDYSDESITVTAEKDGFDSVEKVYMITSLALDNGQGGE